MEEKSNESCLIGIKSEGIDVIHILIDVAREDEHIEECEQRTDECLFLPEEQHTKSETYLYYA